MRGHIRIQKHFGNKIPEPQSIDQAFYMLHCKEGGGECWEGACEAVSGVKPGTPTRVLPVRLWIFWGRSFFGGCQKGGFPKGRFSKRVVLADVLPERTSEKD